MLRTGTTLVEAKSGYGLEKDTEIKMLKVLKQAKTKQPIEIVSNFCGAHSIPKGMGEKEATKDLIEVQLPAIEVFKSTINFLKILGSYKKTRDRS